MTKELKTQLIEKLEQPHSFIRFKCGVDVVHLINIRGKNPMQRLIKMYVNEVVKGSWLDKDCTDHEVKYLRKIKKPIYNKRQLKALKMKVNEIFVEYNLPYFPSAKMAVNHLFKVCPDLTVIETF